MSCVKKYLNVTALMAAGVLTLSLLATGESEAAPTWKKIIDYGQAGYKETSSNWETYSYPDAVGGSYRYLSRLLGNGTRTGTAEWKTTIPYCGMYEVKVSARKTENRTSDADYYYTNSNGGEDHFSINQQSYANMDWDTLGGPGKRYYYKKDQVVRVLLDGDDGQSDCADAASWELKQYMECPPECDASHLDICLTESTCATAGGYWYGDTCNSTPCDASHLNICTTEADCGAASGYWYGGVCNSVSCDGAHIDLCASNADCRAAGGYWHGNVCKSVPVPLVPQSHLLLGTRP